jgi:dTDP-4-dehydrorhamnose reductase
LDQGKDRVRVLVTGAGGLLGQKLCAQLGSHPSFELLGAVRKPVESRAINTVHMDITDAASVKRVFSAFKPQVVVNCAAMTQVDECEVNRTACRLTNVTGVQNLVDECEPAGSRLVHISTDFVFDGRHGPLDESAEPGPVNYYGQTKLEGELLVRKCKTPWTILRTVLVFGVAEDPSRSNIVLWVKASLEQGKPIRVVNDQFRTPTLADDLAAGVVLAIEKGATGIYHVSGKEMMTPYEIALLTARHFKLPESLITETDSTHFTQPARRPLKTGFVIDKAVRELGYRPRSFSEALSLMEAQLKQRAGAR